jgi:hypothetical protein
VKNQRLAFILLGLVILCGGILLWYIEPWSPPDEPSPATRVLTPIESIEKAGPGGDESQEIATVNLPEGPQQLPPSPPIPQVAPQSSQDERHEAFGLMHSVDHIVRKDEPFEVAGKEWTIADLLQQMQPGSKQTPILPSIRESEIGSTIRKPIAGDRTSPEYYAVRVVLQGENLWNIHFAVIQEYLSRRNIILAQNSDKPLANGSSSGVGRLLKFIEGVVFVYNLNANRIEDNLSLIQPHQIVVFFKISDLFSALDQLQSEDLQRLRYVSHYLRLEQSGRASNLLDRRMLREY